MTLLNLFLLLSLKETQFYGQFGQIFLFGDTLYICCLINQGTVNKREDGIAIPSSFFFRLREKLEQACHVYEEAAFLLTPVLELIAQMSGLRFRLVGGPFMS